MSEFSEIFEAFVSTKCAGCHGTKRHHNAFCQWCYRELPAALTSSLWKRFGSGFEEAYHASLSWFRTHPFQGEHRAKQQGFVGGCKLKNLFLLRGWFACEFSGTGVPGPCPQAERRC